MVICSLLGDTTILIASIKYKAFTLHKIVLTFIQHVAVCDLITALFSTLPNALSAFYNSGGSSKILNHARFFITFYVSTMSASLIAAMSLGKLLLLKYPLRAASWSKRQTHKICVGIWITLLFTPVLHFLVDKDDVIFDYRVYTSTYMYLSSVWKTLLPIITFLVLFVPNSTIIISTFLLLKEARKVVRGTEESLRWQGIMTVVLTATVYTLSILPITVYLIVGLLLEKDPEPGPFFVEFFRVAISALNLNVQQMQRKLILHGQQARSEMTLNSVRI